MARNVPAPRAALALADPDDLPVTAREVAVTAAAVVPRQAAADAFRHWLTDQATPLEPARMAEGRRLLEARREAMAWLVRHDPATALQQALSFAEQARLPAEWAPWIEERFATVAELSVLPDCSPDATGPSTQVVLVRDGEAPLRGLGWAGLAGFQSKANLPVEGIALDGWTALAASGVKRVSGAEQAAVESQFPLAPSAEWIAPEAAAVTALIGGQVHRFTSAAAADELQALYAEVAALPGPHSADAFTAALDEDGPPVSEDIRRAARDAASTWTETPKTVLLLKPSFADLLNSVGTTAQWQAVMSEVSAWLSASSYGKTNLVVTVVSRPDIMVLSPASTYEPTGNYTQLMSDAKAKALLAGYNSANYDITVVSFPKLTTWTWSGMATVGGGNLWLNGTKDAKVSAHEFGHNYGIWHASSWDVNDGSIMPATGAPGSSDPRHAEYGDRFSIMGNNAGEYPQGDFSPHGKATLNWITAAQVQTVTAAGTYRINRFDNTAAGANPSLALKLQRAGSQTFWVGYRRSFTGNTYVSNGAYVIWEYSPEHCRLLDMTPDSRTSSHFDDKEDAALALGQTFADPTGNLYITPLTQGGTAPNEWLDVRVDFTVAGNHPPTAAINLPSGPVAARTSVAFSATASDPDADVLTYAWDFGNSQTASGPSVNWTFLTGGSKQVTLRVTDGKGGQAEVTETLSVSDPLTQLEQVTLPDAVQLDDGTLYGGLQVGVSSSYTFASPDGAAWTRGPATLNFTPERLATDSGRVLAVGWMYDSTLAKFVARTALATDGAAWQVQAHGSLPALNSVAYQAGVFAAVGDDGTILTSADGTAWTTLTTPVLTTLNDVVAANSGFVACGDGGTILTSSNGTTWTQRSTPLMWPLLSGLATDGQRVACVGLGPDYWWSEDAGATWVSRSFGLSGFSPGKTACGEGLWLAAENRYNSSSASYDLILAVSTDGLRWELLPVLPLPLDTESVRLADGRLWLYGQTGMVLRSALLPPANHAPALTVAWPATLSARTSASFSATTSDADADPVALLWDVDGQSYHFGSPTTYSFLLGGTKTVSAWAADGRGGHTPTARTYVVDDPLLAWSNITPTELLGTTLTEAARSATRAVFAGGYSAADAPLASATNRGAWIKRDLPIFASALTWRSPGFVAVGQLFDVGSGTWSSAVAHSTDGQTWGEGQYLSGPKLNGVAAADSAYVTVGDSGNIFRSSDGALWNPATSGVASTLTQVAFVGERGLVVGSGGIVLRSEDAGQTWENVSATLGANLSASRVFAAGGRLFLGGYNKIRVYQPDSRAWQDAAVSGGNPGNLEAVVLHGSLYVALSLRYDSTLSRNRRYLLASQDGLTWEAGEMAWGSDMSALLGCGSDLVASGPGTLLANVQGTSGLLVQPATFAAAMGSSEVGTLGTVQIGNTGAGDLAWSVSSNVAWLGTAPASGTATASTSPVSIQLLSSQPPGTHLGTLTFAAPGVPSQTVAVTLTTFIDDHGSIQANASRLVLGTPLAGIIQVADDSDWFILEVDAPGLLTMWTTGTLDTVGELRNANGMIDRKDDSIADSNFSMENLVLPGCYWVKVDGFGPAVGAYQLHSSLVPVGPPFVLKNWGFAAGGTQRQFTVATAIGYRYHVEQNTALDGAWEQVGSVATATTEETVLTVPTASTGGPRRFFRIAVQPPP